jgi:Subtilase family
LEPVAVCVIKGATVEPGQNQTLSIRQKVVVVANRLHDPNNGDNLINGFLARGITPGVYTLSLRGDQVSATGHEVLAAMSGSGKDPQRMSGKASRRMSGTSMASPAVAGLLALVYAEAKQHHLRLDIASVCKILIDSARPIDGVAWDSRLGKGRVDAHAAIQKVNSLAAQGAMHNAAMEIDVV